MSLPLLAVSNLIVDDIRFADGSERRQLGGAGLYAALGAAYWWPDVALVAGVGADLDAHADGAFARWGLRREGLLVRDPWSIVSRLVYHPDGERTETPLHGPQHFERLQIGPAQIPSALLPAAGCYLFEGATPAFWSAYARLRERLGITLWELRADAARVECWPAVRALLPGVDVFSLNRSEAAALLGAGAPSASAMALIDAGARCVVLRLGAEGALIADRTSVLRLTPPPSAVVDVTGAGNAFCGGFLAGLCLQRDDLAAAARCAAAAAALTIAQFGPPDPCRSEALTVLANAARIDALQ